MRLLFADDHPFFLEGFESIIHERYPDIDMVAAVGTGAEAIEKEEELQPDVALLDIRLPDISGIEVARRLKERRPELVVIILTSYSEQGVLRQALAAGATGYIVKETAIPEVVELIRSAYRGNIVIDGKAVSISDVSWHGQALFDQHGDGSLEGLETVPEVAALKPRERDVLRLIIKGKRNREIADELCLSEGTVRNYVHAIYEALELHSRTEIVLWAMENQRP